MRLRIAAFTVALLSLVFGLLPMQPAAAASGSADVAFLVNGTLPTFPCETGCTTLFTGQGTGSGDIVFSSGGGTYNATFTIVNGFVKGDAVYSEPDQVPLCPAIGSASSPTLVSATLTGGSSGVVYRTNSPAELGIINHVSFSLQFRYTRVGATPVITFTGGHVLIGFFFPSSGQGWHLGGITTGGGTGAFEADAARAALLCQSGTPGSLDYIVAGDVSVVVD